MPRLFGYAVTGGENIEPIPAVPAPRRDEPTFSDNQRPSGFWNRVVWYVNQWYPRPEQIPVALRERKASPNPQPAGTQQGISVMTQSGAITRVVPKTYSQQIMGQ